jgi:hypothetical protein
VLTYNILVLGWIEFQIIYQTKNIKPKIKAEKVIKILASAVEDDETAMLNQKFTASNCNFRGLQSISNETGWRRNKHRFF